MSKTYDRKPPPSNRPDELVRRAETEIGSLTAGEKKLFDAVSTGTSVDYSSKKGTLDDPTNANMWGEDRSIRSTCIAWLCRNPLAIPLVHPQGIQILGGSITEEIELLYANIHFPLAFIHCSIPGGIDLRHASVRGLHLDGTHVGRIRADGMSVQGNLTIRHGFRCLGGIRLSGVKVGGNLECNGGEVMNEQGIALYADSIKVSGGAFFRDGFKAQGTVRFVGGSVGGNFEATGSQFINEGNDSLTLDGVRVGGSVHLRDGFLSNGCVRLVKTEISGNLECDNGQFLNKGAMALHAEGLQVHGNVFLRNGTTFIGEVSLYGAVIDQTLNLTGLSRQALPALDLRSARIGTLLDAEIGWPEEGNLRLHGFIYHDIDSDAPIDPDTQIEWIRRQPTKDFSPQPYEQLADVLRKYGREDEMIQVLIAKNKDPARRAHLTRIGRAWDFVFCKTMGYGYRPLRLLYVALSFVLLGWFFFGEGYRSDLMVPANEVVSSSGSGIDGNLGTVHYPRFYSLVYSIDEFVPLVNLHQGDYWIPSAMIPGGLPLIIYLWVHIIMGWILTTMLIVGLTGLLRR
ncbi:MAG: hypothetical protein IH823_00715 [Candidatus Dadabacteria bacterium]|nr:hypothetical protein [Candidatus Dadabacteria bacterium]